MHLKRAPTAVIQFRTVVLRCPWEGGGLEKVHCNCFGESWFIPGTGIIEVFDNEWQGILTTRTYARHR